MSIAGTREEQDEARYRKGVKILFSKDVEIGEVILKQELQNRFPETDEFYPIEEAELEEYNIKIFRRKRKDYDENLFAAIGYYCPECDNIVLGSPEIKYSPLRTMTQNETLELICKNCNEVMSINTLKWT